MNRPAQSGAIRRNPEAEPTMPTKSKLRGQSSQPGQHGGRRAGAGRKPKAAALARAQVIQAVEDRLIGDMGRYVENLTRLADGGYERVHEHYELAATVTIKEPLRDDNGMPKNDAKGHPIVYERRVYPDAKPGEMVLIKRTVETADADRAANQYLIDRVIGRPKQAVEMTGANGGPIEHAFEAAIEKIYGDRPQAGTGGDG